MTCLVREPVVLLRGGAAGAEVERAIAVDVLHFGHVGAPLHQEDGHVSLGMRQRKVRPSTVCQGEAGSDRRVGDDYEKK